MYKNILIPVDLDYPEVAAKAMETAKTFAAAEGARLTVISVQPVVTDEFHTPLPDYQPKMDAYLEKHRGGLGDRLSGLLKIGAPITFEIRHSAKEIDADLIIMGSHDPHFTDYLIGSNAAHVALHTPCSVLVVR